MDRNKKFLKLIPGEKRQIIAEIIRKILINQIGNLKPEKLSGFKNLYKIRSGKIRIIFQKNKPGNKIINIDYRKQIYKKIKN